jgi:hypothetical protein
MDRLEFDFEEALNEEREINSLIDQVQERDPSKLREIGEVALAMRMQQDRIRRLARISVEIENNRDTIHRLLFEKLGIIY